MFIKQLSGSQTFHVFDTPPTKVYVSPPSLSYTCPHDGGCRLDIGCGEHTLTTHFFGHYHTLQAPHFGS